jgi:hypothetical protein
VEKSLCANCNGSVVDTIAKKQFTGIVFKGRRRSFGELAEVNTTAASTRELCPSFESVPTLTATDVIAGCGHLIGTSSHRNSGGAQGKVEASAKKPHTCSGEEEDCEIRSEYGQGLQYISALGLQSRLNTAIPVVNICVTIFPRFN